MQRLLQRDLSHQLHHKQGSQEQGIPVGLPPVTRQKELLLQEVLSHIECEEKKVKKAVS